MAKLRRFTESLSMPNSSYQVVEKIPENLKESFSRAHANEHMTESNDDVIKAAMKLRESSSEKALFDKIIDKLKNEGIKEDKKLWKFPVSRFGNKNGNGRIYSRELWENVIDKQTDAWKNGCGLADHPMDDNDPGQFKTSAIVWLDASIDDVNKLIWAIGTFVGPYGKLAQDIIESGGRIGFSSSGFGETEYDNCTINPDTYQIERLADIVTQPSQSVFGDISSESSSPENIEYAKQTATPVAPVKESLNPQSSIIKEKNMKVNAVNNAPAAEEPAVENKKMEALSKLEMKAIEKYVENMQIDASKIEKPTDKLCEINDLLETVQNCGNKELQEKVEGQLVEARKELEEMVDKAVKLQKDFGSKDLGVLGENVKKIAKQGVLLGEQVNDYKELCEGLTQRNRELARENTVLKSKIAIRDKSNSVKEVRENRRVVLDAQKNDELTKKVEALTSENQTLKENNMRLNAGNRKLETVNGTLETRVKHIMTRVASMNESNTTAGTQLSALKAKLDASQKVVEGLKGQVNRLQAYASNVKSQLDAKIKEAEEKKPEYHLEPKFESYVSPYLNMRENKGLEIEAYWNELRAKYGEAVEPFERQIRGAKTYREAFNAFMKNRNAIDEGLGEATAAAITPNITSKRERKEMLQDAGMNILEESKCTVDDINQRELDDLHARGLN